MSTGYSLIIPVIASPALRVAYWYCKYTAVGPFTHFTHHKLGLTVITFETGFPSLIVNLAVENLRLLLRDKW
jgi:hypothetical protein